MIHPHTTFVGLLPSATTDTWAIRGPVKPIAFVNVVAQNVLLRNNPFVYRATQFVGNIRIRSAPFGRIFILTTPGPFVNAENVTLLVANMR